MTGTKDRSVRRLVLLALLYSSISVFGVAGTRGAVEGRANLAASFLKRGVGARATGMGGAFAAVADDATAPCWNPAGLTGTGTGLFTAVHEKLTFDRSFDYLGLAARAGRRFHLGLSFVRYGMKGFEETELDQSEIIGVDDEGNDLYAIEVTDYFKDEEKCVSVSAACRLQEDLSLGASLKHVSHLLHDHRATATGMDLGLLYRPHRRFGAALVLKDYFSELAWDTATGRRDRIARENVLGFSYRFGRLALVGLDLSRTDDSDLRYRAGVEARPLPGVALRLGSNDGRMAGGAGFAWRDWTIDYSFEDALLDDVHRFSSSLAFAALPRLPSLRLPRSWRIRKRDREKKPETEAPPPPPPTPETGHGSSLIDVFREADRLQEEKKIDEAIAILRSATGDFPENAELYYRLGMLQVMAGQTDEGQFSYIKAMNLDPESASARLAEKHFKLRTVRKRLEPADGPSGAPAPADAAVEVLIEFSQRPIEEIMADTARWNDRFSFRYEEGKQIITATGNGRTAHLRIGKGEMWCDGRYLTIDHPPKREKNCVYIHEDVLRRLDGLFFSNK